MYARVRARVCVYLVLPRCIAHIGDSVAMRHRRRGGKRACMHTHVRARAHTHVCTRVAACMYAWTRLCKYPAEASNPSGGHCCQTYWGLFLRQPEGGDEEEEEKEEEENEDEEAVDEEMAEGSQVGGSKGGGPRKGGRGRVVSFIDL